MVSPSVAHVRLQARGMIDQIVTTLLKEGYQPEKAYRIALNEAEEWATMQRMTTTRDPAASYHVTPHPFGWVIRQPNKVHPCLVFHTQEEAVEFGQALAAASNSPLIVHNDNGDIQMRIVYQ